MEKLYGEENACVSQMQQMLGLLATGTLHQCSWLYLLFPFVHAQRFLQDLSHREIQIILRALRIILTSHIPHPVRNSACLRSVPADDVHTVCTYSVHHESLYRDENCNVVFYEFQPELNPV
jgi:hypothetical protein